VIACPACGGIRFMKFEYDPRQPENDGLLTIYTCLKCGDQVRLYWASRMNQGGITTTQGVPPVVSISEKSR